MRRLLGGVLLGLMLAGSSGCLLPIYSADRGERAEELFFTAENLRAIRDEWRRIWFLDQPDHMTPVRVHGGII